MEDPDRRFFEIFRIGIIDVQELLWIPVSQRKPAALDLDHQAVSFFEGMRHIRQFKFHPLCLAGFEGNRVFKTVPEFAPHDLAPTSIW